VGSTLYLDFEWQSRLSIRRYGLYRCAADPTMRVLCCGWRFAADGAPESEPRLWMPQAATAAGLDLLGAACGPSQDRFLELAADPSVRVVAHNAEVERAVLLRKFGVEVPLSRLDDTAARARRAGLPPALDDLCDALALDEQKAADGAHVMMKLARPRRPSREDRSEFWSEAKKPEDFARLYAYCLADVRALAAVDRALPPLEPAERRRWELTARMNLRGLRVDLPALGTALEVSARAGRSLDRRFEELVGVGPRSPRAREVLGLSSLDKATVRDALKRPDLTPVQREALEVRQRVAKSSVKKLEAFLNRTSDTDARLRGSMVYCGAERTARWSAGGVQPHNFPRGLGEGTDAAFGELRSGALELVHDDVLATLSGMLRGFILGPLLVGDFAQVECRTLAWMAGQDDLTQMFRDGADPYCEMASAIYGRPVTKKEHPFERFIGKESVLGCGYQLGARKFAEHLDVKADVQVDEAFAQRVVSTFRRRFPKVVRLWELLGRGLVWVLREGCERGVEVGPVRMGVGAAGRVPHAWVELPSGRRLYYQRAELVSDGSGGLDVQYLGRDQYRGGSWGMVRTYGGKITENVVQATSRDLLAEAMLRVADAGFPVVLTVHDEVVSELPDGGPGGGSDPEGNLRAFERLVAVVPAWAEGLPLKAECFACERYRK
jgi:DNA polymerase